MSESTTFEEERAGTARLTLKIQHADCWTLEVTEETAAGIVAHTVYNTPQDTVKGHFTVFADHIAEVTEFIETARESRLTDSITELTPRHEFDKNSSNIGNTTREIMVEYDPDNSITNALLEYGFVHDAPVRVNDGWEHWPVIDTGEGDLDDRLGSLEAATDAEITVTKISSVTKAEGDISHRTDRLSDRQREVLNLACAHNYYAWPRETTTRELADELDISKTTLLEHLRKAEAKLLNQ